jgi:hypothetical protein
MNYDCIFNFVSDMIRDAALWLSFRISIGINVQVDGLSFQFSQSVENFGISLENVIEFGIFIRILR